MLLILEEILKLVSAVILVRQVKTLSFTQRLHIFDMQETDSRYVGEENRKTIFFFLVGLDLYQDDGLQ